MKNRYTDRRLYFNELVQTSREYLMNYISDFCKTSHIRKVIEIGCGEGGILVPFAETGCHVCGIDISQGKIRNAERFFAEDGLKGEFICSDFIQMDLSEHHGVYDLIIIHDVIEHIEPEFKAEFMKRTGNLLKKDGIIMAAFPSWKMAFGGHQQICRNRLCRIPLIHLLPLGMYKGYLKLCKEKKETIEELMSIRRSRMSIESFESLCRSADLRILSRRLWVINPHYKAKFRLTPLQLHICFHKSRWLRDRLASSCFYILSSSRCSGSKSKE